jgi:hypothetical protein
MTDNAANNTQDSMQLWWANVGSRAMRFLSNGQKLEKTWQQRGKGRDSEQRIELMGAVTLDRVLTEAEALPKDEREMLESLLRQRRIEAWRQETAAEAKSVIKAFRSGKLKGQSAESLIASLRRSK